MPRKATSPLEIEQILRVNALLGKIEVVPAPHLAVSTADGKTHVGQFVSQKVGNRPAKNGRKISYYGSLELLTASSKIEIDYLDIVLIHPQ